jgi:hypothetical protein
MTESELRKLHPESFKMTKEEAMTTQKKLAGLTKQQLADYKSGKLKLPEIPRNARYNFGKDRLTLHTPTMKGREERKWFVAKMIRKRYHLFQIRKDFVKKYKCSANTAMKYIRKTFEEFQDQYTPEKRGHLMTEHLEFLREASRRAMMNKDYSACEKLSRQYAECIRFLNPSAFNSLTIDNRSQTAVISDAHSAAEITLKTLEEMSTNDFLERYINHRPVKKAIGESIAGAEIGSFGRPQQMLPCSDAPYNDKGGTS